MTGNNITMILFDRYEEILAKENVPEKKIVHENVDDEENYDDFDWDAFEKEE